MKSKYNDILNLPHKRSETRPHMSNHDRASQFAPFSALSGYGDAVIEAARTTDKKRFLSDCEAEQLDIKLRFILRHISDEPKIKITFFRKDNKKPGGKYMSCTGTVEKIDNNSHTVTMKSGEEISVDDIYTIEGDVFAFIENEV